nr:hypothetical protein [Tanacetum cinerariifolium]
MHIDTSALDFPSRDSFSCCVNWVCVLLRNLTSLTITMTSVFICLMMEIYQWRGFNGYMNEEDGELYVLTDTYRIIVIFFLERCIWILAWMIVEGYESIAQGIEDYDTEEYNNYVEAQDDV